MIDRTEAKTALAEIGEARDRVDRMHGYAEAAPFLILWGLIWLVCNSVTEFAPQWSGVAWITGLVIGMPATVALSIMKGRQRAARDPVAAHSEDGRKFGVTMGAIMAFLVLVMVIVWPLDPRQMNAVISLFWACVYMGAGVWIGWRPVWIGAVTAAAVLFGFLVLDQYYFLWMAVAGGGSLIAGGLWLRKV